MKNPPCLHTADANKMRPLRFRQSGGAPIRYPDLSRICRLHGDRLAGALHPFPLRITRRERPFEIVLRYYTPPRAKSKGVSSADTPFIIGFYPVALTFSAIFSAVSASSPWVITDKSHVGSASHDQMICTISSPTISCASVPWREMVDIWASSVL